MLKYSKGQKISLNLSLIQVNGSSESSASVEYKIYDSNNTLIIAGIPLYNNALESYVDIINPWTDQTEGIYYIKWIITNTTEEFANTVIEELYIEEYDEKLNKLLGLLHENMVIDQTVYDQYGNLSDARIRLYSNSSSVGTDNDILSTYRLHSNSSSLGKFTTWTQVKI